MKLKIDECLTWLETDRHGVAYFHKTKPPRAYTFEKEYEMSAEIFCNLEPDALYERNGEEWEKVR